MGIEKVLETQMAFLGCGRNLHYPLGSFLFPENDELTATFMASSLFLSFLEDDDNDNLKL